MSPSIVLWEISGVLASDTWVFASALASTLGSDPDVFTCRSHLGTDREIVERGLSLVSRGDAATCSTDELLNALQGEFAARRAELAEQGRARGSAELLSRLKQHDPTTVFAPLTGHTAANAEVVLSAVGLDRYFDLPLGTYGGDVHGRDDLFPAAWVAVADRYGKEGARDLVVVTGNPVDARAAVDAGVRVVGVTGEDEVRAELAACGAVGVFRGLSDVDRLVDAVTS